MARTESADERKHEQSTRQRFFGIAFGWRKVWRARLGAAPQTSHRGAAAPLPQQFRPIVSHRIPTTPASTQREPPRQEPPPPRASWVAIDQPQEVETSPGRRRRGLFRSRAMLLVVMATILIAGLLLYTYLSSERDASSYAHERTGLSSANSEHPGDRQADAGSVTTRVAPAPSAPGSIDDTWPEGEPTTSSAPRRAAPRVIHRAAVAETSKDRTHSDLSTSDDERSASATVRAFYSALSAGDGASAAQLVVPAKRQSGPLSADALSRYYSSFRRPLQVRRLTPVDANTVQVAYDYVLADGGVCRGNVRCRSGARGRRHAGEPYQNAGALLKERIHPAGAALLAR